MYPYVFIEGPDKHDNSLDYLCRRNAKFDTTRMFYPRAGKLQDSVYFKFVLAHTLTERRVETDLLADRWL
jgi:hypothetical protein